MICIDKNAKDYVAIRSNSLKSFEIRLNQIMKSIKYLSFLLLLSTEVLTLNSIPPGVFNTPSEAQKKVQLRIEGSDEDVKKAVRQFIPARFKVIGGAPKFVVLQSITADDADKMGLVSATALGTPPPPLTLVVLEGRFEVTQWMGGISNPQEGKAQQTPETARYVLYVIDRCVGLPTATGYSSNPKFLEHLFKPFTPGKSSKKIRRAAKSSQPIRTTMQRKRLNKSQCPKEFVPPPGLAPSQSYLLA